MDSRQEPEHDELKRLREENARLTGYFRQRCESAFAEKPVAENLQIDDNARHSIVVLGASGDLAIKKLFPALCSLFRSGLLPKKCAVVGYARSELTVADFRARVASKLPAGSEAFLSTVHYHHGGYDSVEDMRGLSAFLCGLEAGPETAANRLFYFSVPPSVFSAAAKAVHEGCKAPRGWTRLVLEKPFGRDLATSRVMRCELGSLFDESALFRIDHYLGKAMVLNLLSLRFGNVFLQNPIWSRQFVSNVQITFKEDIGTEGRGGYFDNYGIIRDVMQNHLLQVLAIVAMEPPVTLAAEDIRDEKVKVLRAIPPVALEDVVIGQYEGYTDEPGVPKDSVTPTYAVARLFVNNTRWQGVPFVLKCGKALNERKAEVRVQFHNGLTYLFPSALPNELVVRIQPAEAVYMKVMIKEPGITAPTDIAQAELDLTFGDRFRGTKLPEAYEYLIRDTLRGDQSLFVRADELDAAWKILTPLLHELERTKTKPIIYKKGIRGVPEGDKLVRDSGYVFTSAKYKWQKPTCDPQPAKK